MPKIRPGMKRPPPDFKEIAEELDSFDVQLKDALHEEESANNSDGVKGKPIHSKKHGVTWAVSKVNRSRARFVFEAFRSRKISEACLKYCCDMNFVDNQMLETFRV
eukprot:CAMPEP_0176428850 /NCGR_PEP_ID=MMETSP0127-20121128/13381_1 /TAXON_ID=938130 /ORGANISM="Platyophrya macrostoma, Strain WH" /LENGTH=105 /DNA_ID=CAMNT_0017810583 /DNA_START=53 /DNA_END=370 /DNA_ORIENTATION=+